MGARSAGPLVAWLAAFWVPAASAERLALTAYTTDDGLAHDRIFRIVPDPRGFVWFCTADGLSRFDGQRFRTYGVADGLPVAFVNDLLPARDGAYWVATNGGGIARFRPQDPPGERRFTVFPVGAENVTSEVYRLREDKRGTIWAGTLGGLFRRTSESADAGFAPFPLAVPGHPDRSIRVWALAPGRSGELWVGHNRGLSRIADDGRVAHFAIQATPAGDNVWDLLIDRAGRLWITHERTLTAFLPPATGGSPFPWSSLLEGAAAVREDGTLRLPEGPGEAVRYGRAHGLVKDAAGPVVETSHGEIWIGSPLSAFDGRRFRVYSSADGLPDSTVISLAEDRDGGLWIGTRTRGAMRSRPTLVRKHPLGGRPGERSGDDIVTSFFEDSGAVFAVSGTGHMFRVDAESRVTTLALPVPRAPRAPVPDARPEVLRSRTGEWWIGTSAGLMRVSGVGAEEVASKAPHAVYTTRDGLGSDAIGVLHEDRSGDLWIGHSAPADRPLARWSASTASVQAYGADQGLRAHDTVSAMAEDASGRLFIGFLEGGVARREGDRFSRLPGLDPAVVGGVFDLLADATGRLWVATTRGGLVRIEDPAAVEPRVRVFTLADGLASNGVRAVIDDAWGRIYALTARGVDCLDPTTFQRLRRFTTAHGVPNYYFLAAFRDARGRLWFGTREGLASLDPEPWKPLGQPATLIDRLLVSGVRQPVADLGQREVGPLVLAHDQNTLQLDFLAVDFSGEPTRFRYRLDDADDEWNTPTVERTVHYGRLRPGSYRFRVKEADAPDALAAEVAFTIRPPVWERAWFRVALALALVGLAGLAYRVRVARLLALERVRTRIAADLHDDIGSGLSRIALVTEVVKRDVQETHGEAARRLEEVAGSARELLDATSDMVWSIDPRHDRLDDLAARLRAFGSDLLQPLGMAWHLEVEGDAARVRLHPEQRRHLYLIVKEALHNVARHSGARSARLRIAEKRRSLSVELYDDGRGLATADAPTSRGGHGLANMKSRAEALGGRLEVVGNADGGTTVRVELPLTA